MNVTVLIIIVLLIAFGVCLLFVRRRYKKPMDVAIKRAQMSEHLKSVFIDNISRTLISPMSDVVGLADKILEEKDENMQPELVRKLATGISDRSKDILDYVKQLHEMSKFEGITAAFTFIEVNLIELMASYRRETMNYTHPDIAVRVTSDLSPHCRGILDTNLMHQLMMLLLTNAARHVTEGDIIIRYGCERRGLQVTINYSSRVHTELPTDDAISLLQKEDSLKNAGKDSVLGVAICKAIVDMLGGEFFMDTDSNMKTVVSFWLPCKMKDLYRDV